MSRLVLLVALLVLALIVGPSCAILDPILYPVSVTHAEGHTYDEVVSAVREGRVASVTVHVTPDTGRPEWLELALEGSSQHWYLADGDRAAAAVAVVDDYNAAAPAQQHIPVQQLPLWTGPQPVSSGPTPTQHPRP